MREHGQQICVNYLFAPASEQTGFTLLYVLYVVYFYIFPYRLLRFSVTVLFLQSLNYLLSINFHSFSGIVTGGTKCSTIPLPLRRQGEA